MTTVTGLPPAAASLPGVPLDRPPSAAAVQARQAEAASGRTPGAGEDPITRNGIIGIAGLDRIGRLQPRRLAQEPPPDPEDPAGPPPTFQTTPLEKLHYPPSPLQQLARRLRDAQNDAVRRAEPSEPLAAGSGPPATGATDDTDSTTPAAPAKVSGYEAQTDAVGTEAAAGAAEPAALNIRR